MRQETKKKRILDAVFSEASGQIVDSPRFKEHLERTFHNAGSRDLMEAGYRVRIVERKLTPFRELVPLGPVNQILRSGQPTEKMVEAVTEYLDSHDKQGLGLPSRPYSLAGFSLMREVLDEFVTAAMLANRISSEDFELQAELYHRFVAYGYNYRVAEELVCERQIGPKSMPAEETGRRGAVWTSFRGRPNTESLLREKAGVVADLITSSLDDGIILAFAMKDQRPNIRLGEEEALDAKAESAALWLRIAYELAARHLHEQAMNVFVDSLGTDVVEELCDQGADTEVLSECYREFVAYEKWIEEGGGSPKGTLFREYANRLAASLAVGPDAVFNAVITNLLLKRLLSWDLPSLMKG